MTFSLIPSASDQCGIIHAKVEKYIKKKAWHDIVLLRRQIEEKIR